MKITEQQLNRKIAGLRGVKMSMVVECPNYTGDMNLATVLLGEIPGGSLDKDDSDWVAWILLPGTICGLTAKTSAIHASPSFAICLAWLQWKTGEAVEVES